MLAKISNYLQLMRVDKPIGWLLLLWPTLWALWIAGEGQPDPLYVWVFVLEVFIMRSAGCVINDFADRKIDGKVERTRNRPLASGVLKANQALLLFIFLGLIALCIMFVCLPAKVWPWAIPGAAVTIVYPFMKRFIQAPQLVLGLAFSFSIPMVYVTLDHHFDINFVLLLFVNFIWVLVYDTQYAMSDREDDMKVGINSSAIFFADKDKLIIACLQCCIVLIWFVLMLRLNMSSTFIATLGLAVGLFVYQQWLIRDRQRQLCFQAFLNNGWLGGFIWFGLLVGL